MTRLEEIEARKVEIKSEVESTEEVEKLEELNEEVDALNEEAQQITEAEEQNEVAESLEEQPEVKAKATEVSMEVKKEEKVMEMRNTKEYIDAYAEYIKTEKDDELRSLLTENVSGSIAVPDFVLDEVKTAWDKNELLSKVRKTNVKGNLRVQFEISGTDAVVHTEGAYAVEEEELVEGIVELQPVSIKKWISISDEVMDLRGEAFLRYIYDELTYRIAKKAADLLISKITALSGSASSSAPSVGIITKAPAMDTIAQAVGNLSDEATNPTIVMNKLTYADFKAIQYANNYGVDPFEGLTVIFNNSLPAYSAANTNDIYMIVGDFNEGAIANFPAGEGIEIKVDEMSRKKEDLVEILGREFIALGVVADKAFVQVKKPTSI
ncbi:MAG: phage major capsid protein [Bacilli bacterium]|nr:phage major capsid protein [Bacilli bacterium]MBR6690767.1 phage major capsid protein [Bacilli bacterium]